MSYETLCPSKIKDSYWISVTNSYDTALTNDSGKWQVFLPINDLDAAWRKVADLTLSGNLGVCAKSSTAMPNPNAIDNNIKVIIVWTKNYKDLKDVARVAWMLYQEKIFKEGVLNYKTDDVTSQGLYAKDGFKTSKYSIGIDSFERNKSLEKLTAFLEQKYSTQREIPTNNSQTIYKNPSEDFEQYYQSFSYNDEVLGPNSGKWTIHVPLNELNATWYKVAELTLNGDLGPLSSTATAKPYPYAKDQNIKVMSIHTKDYRNLQDVARVALTLYKQNVLKSSVIHFTTKKHVFTISVSLESLKINDSEEKLANFMMDKMQRVKRYT